MNEVLAMHGIKNESLEYLLIYGHPHLLDHFLIHILYLNSQTVERYWDCTGKGRLVRQH